MIKNSLQVIFAIFLNSLIVVLFQGNLASIKKIVRLEQGTGVII